MIKITALFCEHQPAPTGVCATPRFSWKIESAERCIMQTECQIQVADTSTFSGHLYDSGKISSSESHLVQLPFPLKPVSRYWWRVKVWTNNKEESCWSDAAFFITDLPENQGFDAAFISGETHDSGANSAATMVRGEFTLKSGIRSAIIYTTALGVYHLHVNGQRICNWHMAPGWTEYNSRILYQCHDVTDIVRDGVNAVGAAVGAGWYKGDLAGWLGRRNVYGVQTAFAMQLIVKYNDHEIETIYTGSDWKTAEHAATYSEIYHGEIYDARLEQPGWDKPGFDDSHWNAVKTIAVDKNILVSQDGLPVCPREVLTPVSFFIAPNGEKIMDFGQNLTGFIRFSVSGKAGDVVSYTHAEILDKDGNFYTRNLRSAKQQITYTLKGVEKEVYQPNFTFQGFRYIRIEQFPGEITVNNFEAVVIHSDMVETGSFHSSNDKLNQLESNIRWGMKGNFVDIPTDCPQRDERLGWTGDAQVFIRASCYLHNTTAFFRKWLRDLAMAQMPNGGVPNVVPEILNNHMPEDEIIATDTAVAGWGDAGVICPWTVYKYSSDKGILEEQYPSMKGWVEFVHSRAQDGLLWNKDSQLGDWVALDAKEGSYFGATPVDLIATAYYAYSTELLAKTAEILDLPADAHYYFELRKNIGDAFVKEFFTLNGRLCARTQTSHILALYFGLTPPKFKQRTIDTLVEIIGENDNHLSTGFLGTPYICHALSENNRLDLAYELLLKEDYPSWLYSLSKGATTIWEHWDGMKPDGTMWSDNMNSFNHYAYGAVADWMYSVIGGIDSTEHHPGYKCSLIAPRPGGGITNAKVTQDTPFGQLVSDWRIEKNQFLLDVFIPVNTTCTITLPNGKITKTDGLSFVFSGNGMSAKTGSGSYHFAVDLLETPR